MIGPEGYMSFHNNTVKIRSHVSNIENRSQRPCIQYIEVDYVPTTMPLETHKNSQMWEITDFYTTKPLNNSRKNLWTRIVPLIALQGVPQTIEIILSLI